MADLALTFGIKPPRAPIEHRALRVRTLFLLNVAQGLPLGLIVGRVLGGLGLGWLDALDGIPLMFSAITLSSLVAACFAFAATVGR